jgi:hypothetical protein
MQDMLPNVLMKIVFIIKSFHLLQASKWVRDVVHVQFSLNILCGHTRLLCVNKFSAKSYAVTSFSVSHRFLEVSFPHTIFFFSRWLHNTFSLWEFFFPFFFFFIRVLECCSVVFLMHPPPQNHIHPYHIFSLAIKFYSLFSLSPSLEWLISYTQWV